MYENHFKILMNDSVERRVYARVLMALKISKKVERNDNYFAFMDYKFKAISGKLDLNISLPLLDNCGIAEIMAIYRAA